MNRLKHETKALLRSMQISSTSVFIFTEGISNDRFFYDQVLRKNLAQNSPKFEFKTAREIAGTNGGGKKALLSFFSELSDTNHLVTDFGDKKTTAIFFLDKDIDDIEGKKIESQHLIYTPYYDIENHHFVYGDLVKATASAASLDIKSSESLIKTSDNWRESAANRWREWVTLCVAARIRKLQNRCNYKSCSKINVPLNGNSCPEKLAAEIADMKMESGLGEEEIDKALVDAKLIVDQYYANKKFDLIFKGKWYSTILESDLKDRFKKNADTDYFGKKICSNLAQTIDYRAPWAQHFYKPVARLIAKTIT